MHCHCLLNVTPSPMDCHQAGSVESQPLPLGHQTHEQWVVVLSICTRGDLITRSRGVLHWVIASCVLTLVFIPVNLLLSWKQGAIMCSSFGWDITRSRLTPTIKKVHHLTLIDEFLRFQPFPLSFCSNSILLLKTETRLDMGLNNYTVKFWMRDFCLPGASNLKLPGIRLHQSSNENSQLALRCIQSVNVWATLSL